VEGLGQGHKTMVVPGFTGPLAYRTSFQHEQRRALHTASGSLHLPNRQAWWGVCVCVGGGGTCGMLWER
jgi:hypothetical protein